MRPPKRQWAPGLAHTHTYYLMEGDRVLGRVVPNPRQGDGRATWFAYVGRRKVGATWQIAEAREMVEQRMIAASTEDAETQPKTKAGNRI
jgi:hypothetical protein